MSDTSLSTGVDVFFAPESIALVGVSGRPDSFTANALRYLVRDYAGPVYPVNPKHESIADVRCYSSLQAIGAPVDLVLCMVPANAAVGVVKEAGGIGVRGVSIFAAGFAEAGVDGEVRQRQLISAARAVGVRVVGPNCQGTVNFHNGTMASFSRALEHITLPPGEVAYLGQSGAVGSSLLNLAQERGLGYSLWASTGNQADVEVAELASYALDHEPTKVLMLYLEDVSDGYNLIRIIEQASNRAKRVVLLRSGRSVEGRRASRSHTGALIGDDQLAFDLAARRAGAVLVEDVDEFLDAAAGLATLAQGDGGNRLGVVTTSGGLGILAADLAARHQFSLATLQPRTMDALGELLPPFASTANPVDVTYQFFARESPFIEKPGGTSPLQEVVRTLANSGDVDAVMVVITMVVGDLARGLVEDVSTLANELRIPLLFVWLAGHELTKEARAVQREQGLPAFASIGGALRLGVLLRDATQSVLRPADAPPWNADVDARLRQLAAGGLPTEAATLTLLDLIGVPYPEAELAETPEEAAAMAARFDAPVAIKLQAPGLVHKTEAGAVRLEVHPADVGSATRELLALSPQAAGVLVSRMAPPGFEILVSARQLDPRHPPLVSMAVGGVHAEIYRDVANEIMPADRAQLEDALRRLRAAPLLDGYRGSPPLDVEAVADISCRVGWAVQRSEGLLRELELNPVTVYPQGEGALALDALSVTGESATFRRPST